MKFFFLPVLLAAVTLPVLAQPRSPAKKAPPARSNTATSSAAKKPAKPVAKKDEKAELDKAMAAENPEEKAKALAGFLADFPESSSRPQVLESLTAARVAAAQSQFETGERDAALKLVRKALDEAPAPYSEKLFADAVSKIPMLTFSLAGAAAAYESADAIEKNAAANVPQLLSLSNFYLNLENGSEAKRLAEAALKLDERSAAAYQTLAMANRLNFDLDASTAAYEKAVELDPESAAARQGLAEMKRASGKPDEAAAIFSALIEKDPNDLRSVNGRILSLFDAGKRTEAEAEFAKVIEAEKGNLVLLAGVAYWYAVNGANAKAIEFAGKAIDLEPRYIWSHIALARGLAGEGRFLDAEQVLLKARKYGNFPTLDYEIAAMKFGAGFYREAADELQKSFAVKDGNVSTKLGRRIERSDKNFIDLLSAERRASILVPKAADNTADAEKMRSLLEFVTLVNEKVPDETKASDAAAAFAAGSDKMRFHRTIFAASQLAERSAAPAKVLELTKAAVSSVDDGLSVPLAAGPIMASELYASRTAAIAADKYVLVPEVAKQTLSAIARGRIEELAGTALMQQKNNAEAAVRLRRANSILPEKSAWWRSSHWKLGTVLEADGKAKEALDAYVKSYTSAEPDADKYAVIESVYKRVNNGTEGLEALVGSNPAKPAEKSAENAASTAIEAKSEVKTEIKEIPPTEIKAEPRPEKKAETAEVKPAETSTNSPLEKEVPKVAESPSPLPETKPIVTGKAPNEKPVDEALKSSENVQKPDEFKAKTLDDAAAKPEEKKVEVPDETKLSAEARKTTETKAPAEIVRKTPEIKPDETKSEASSPETKPTPKPLFEPVVIEIKNSKTAKTLEMPTENRPGENTGATRPRVIIGKDFAGEAVPSCSISVSQSSISLASGKGSIGVLVGVENGDLKDVKYSSTSPKNVDVMLDTETAGVPGKALYVIRSMTETPGEYKVTFESPCGTKDVRVSVR